MSPELINQITRMEVIYSSIPGLLFVILYQTRGWWKTAIGRLMMFFIGTLEAVLLLTVVAMFWPKVVSSPYVGLICWTAIGAAFTWMFVEFIRAGMHKGEHSKHKVK